MSLCGAQDHPEQDAPLAEEAVTSDPETPYERYAKDVAVATTPPRPQSNIPPKPNTVARLEAIMASGLGSIGIFGEAQMRRVEDEALMEDMSQVIRPPTGVCIRPEVWLTP